MLAYAPIVARNTDTPHRLTCCIDDETPLSMALDGMRGEPYGDPYNFVSAPSKDKPYPEYYRSLRYTGVGWYYGGFYQGIGFLAYGPLQALGAPPFPTAPIVLRIVSLISGLLALFFTYNYAYRNWGRVAAAVAALILFAEPLFVYYSSIVHPDATQFGLSVLAVAFALRHLKSGDHASLGALGVISGVIQGTKLGGPWMIPLVAVATMVGLTRQQPDLGIRRYVLHLAGCGAVLAAVALAAWVITTPYAFLEPDFFEMTGIYYKLQASNSFAPVTPKDYLAALWTHCGSLLMLAALGGSLVIAVRAVAKRSIPWPAVLVFVLGMSQLLWFSSVIKLWVIMAYLFTTVGMIALLAGYFAETLYRAIGRTGHIGRIAAVGIAGLAMLLPLGPWYNVAAVALMYRALDSYSSLEIGRWAEAGNIPRDARILWDNPGDFDPAKFPNGRMIGDLLNYNHLHRRRPDYIVLSSSMYDSTWFAYLIKTQKYSMQNEGPNSVRLYQDLLATNRPGPTSVPGIDYVRSFGSDVGGSESCRANAGERSYEPWVGADTPQRMSNFILGILGTNPVGVWLASAVAEQLFLVNVAGHTFDAGRGRTCLSHGPVLRLYRVNPPGAANGFAQAFASSSRPTSKPHAAFDGEPSYWVPDPQDVAPAVGFDFGGRAAEMVDHFRIDWPKPAVTAARIEVEYSDDGEGWKPAGALDVSAAPKDDFAASEHELPSGLGAHRFWRILMQRRPDHGAIAVREVRFGKKSS